MKGIGLTGVGQLPPAGAWRAETPPKGCGSIAGYTTESDGASAIWKLKETRDTCRIARRVRNLTTDILPPTPFQGLREAVVRLQVQRFRFVFTAVDDLGLPEYKGSTFRGAFGSSFLKLGSISGVVCQCTEARMKPSEPSGTLKLPRSWCLRCR